MWPPKKIIKIPVIMKKFRIYILAIATFLLFFAGCIVNVGVDQTVNLPD
jgi:hypothetical protein